MGGYLGCSLIDVMLNYRSLRGTYYYHLNIKEIDHIVFIIDPFHIVISLSNRSSIEKLIKPFLKMKGQIAY